MIWKTTISKITETITTGLSRQFKSFGIIMILAFLGSTPNLFAQSAECEIIEAECPPSNLFEPCGDVTVDDVLGNYITWTGPDYSLECGDGNTYQYQISFDLPEGKEECWEFYKVQRVGTGSGTLRLWSSDGSASGIAEVTSPSFYMDEIVNASMDVFAPNNQDFKVDVYLEEADGSKSGILDSFNVIGNNSLTNYQYSVDPSYFDGSGSYDDNKIFRLYFEFSAINGTNLNNKSYIEFITIDAGLFGSACAAEANFAVVSTHNPGDFFPVGTTTVTYTATCNGCEEFLQESCSFDVTVNPLPEVNISSDTELALDCANSSTTLTASGGTSYAWTNSNGDDLGTNASITVSTEDTFTVTVSNDNGCTDTGSVSTTLNNTDPTAVINNNNGLALDCANSSTTLTASGGTSYAWTNSNDDDLGTNASITVSTQDTFTVTVTAENGCTDTESVSTTLDNTPPTANAGEDQSQCNNSSFTLAGNTPSAGSGEWTVVSGSASIANPGSPTSGVTVAAGNKVTLRWTLTIGECSDSDEVTIENFEDVTANAGVDQSQCNNSSFTLAGNTPSAGSGEWTVVSGSASIADSSSPTSGVTVAAGNKATLRWTITNGDCSDSDEVTIENFEDVTANAGVDQSQCNNSSFTLAGNTPSAGSGEWTVVSGSASIADSSSPTSGVTVAAGNKTTLRWTITNGDCSDSDEVTIENFEDVTANAGEDQSQCNNSSFTLAGNTPSASSGEWTVVSGSASIADPSSPTSGVTVAAGNKTTLRWTITNGDCSDSDEVTIDNFEDVTANAGEDQSQCNNSSFTLAGNTPSAGSGEWTVVSGSASIANPGSPTSGVTVAAGNKTTLRWTITNGDCSDSDEVTIENFEDVTANAGVDQSQCNNSSFTLAGNTPSAGSGEWTVVSGSASIADSSSPTSGVTVAAGNKATLRWTITNGDCSDSDEVTIENFEDVTANAGVDQSQCNNSSFTLAGNTSSAGSGEWTVVSGSASIDDSSSPTSGVTVAVGNKATLRWTITNGDCTDFDEVTIENFVLPGAPVSGGNQSECYFGSGQTLTATATTPDGISVVWYNASTNGSVVSPTLDNVGSAIFYAEAKNDLTDCVSSERTAVTLEILPEITLSVEANTVTCNGEEDGMITFTNSDHSTVTIYDSTNSDVTLKNGSLSAGVYTVVASETGGNLDGTCTKELKIGILVRDNESPMISVPATLNVEACEASGFTSESARFPLDTDGSDNIINDFYTDGYTASDDQAVESITYIDAIDYSGCLPVITRTFYVEDNCGAESFATTVINLIDNTDPYFNEALPQASLTVECDSVPEAAILTADDNCSGEVTVTYNEEFSGLDDDCANEYTITRNWYAEDCSGKEVSFTQVITVVDTTAPEFDQEILPTAELIVECDNIPAAATLTATDNCAGALDVTYTEEFTGQDDECANEYTIVRKWAAADCAGNVLEYVQTITVEDTVAPEFDQETLPTADLTVECDNIPAAATLTATDNCAGALDVNYSEEFTGLDDECANEYTIVRKWTAADCAGNDLEYIQTITVEDNSAPVFNETFPEVTIDVQCDNIPEAVTLTATDNCSGELTVNYTEEFAGLDDDCSSAYTITRNWTATDCAGNEISHTQVINVTDTTAPEFNEIIPADMDMECENLPEVPTITATDNCEGDVTVEFTETSNKEGEDDKDFTVIRTWTATDCAGNITSQSQNINIINTGAPSFNENLPNDITVECDAVPEAVVLTASDNCIAEAEVTFKEVLTGKNDDCANEYTVTRTWTASDEANNETVHVQVITVIDSTAPEFDQELPETAITVECTSVPEAITLTATDNCSENVTVNYSEELADLDDDCASTYTITRTWSVSDCAGNENSFTQTIDVIDTTAPTFDGELPSETITVECDSVPESMTLTASDNCSETATVKFNEEISERESDADNNYTITRTWTASDCAGNETRFIQVVNVEDTTTPVITECATEVNVSADAGVCDASGVQLGMPSATDNCDTELTYENDAPEVFPVGQTIVTWTITDASNNSVQCEQMVNVTDDEAPQINDMEDITVNNDAGICGAVVRFEDATATDNCGVESIIMTEGLDSGSEFPLGKTTVTYVATDTAGLTATTSFTVTVIDNEAPSIECPENITIDVAFGTTSTVVTYDALTVTDNCGGTTTTMTSGIASGEEFPVGETTITFTVTDDNGNEATCEFTVTVNENEAPAPPPAPNPTVGVAPTCANPLGSIVIETQEGVTYSIDGENYVDSAVFENIEPGTYEVTVKDEFGQVSEVTTITIENPVASDIELVNNGVIDLCIEDSIYDLFELFTGDYDDSGVWVDTENSGALDNGFVDPSMLTAGQAYTFEYQVTGNCNSTTEVSVLVNDDCIVLDCNLTDLKDSISKAVTPNGDNRNDFFEVDLDTECGFTYDLKIFNRWGAEVFTAQNYQNNWDGFSKSSFTNSNQLPSGTYFYILEIRNSEFKPIQGYIYLGTK